MTLDKGRAGVACMPGAMLRPRVGMAWIVAEPHAEVLARSCVVGLCPERDAASGIAF